MAYNLIVKIGPIHVGDELLAAEVLLEVLQAIPAGFPVPIAAFIDEDELAGEVVD